MVTALIDFLPTVGVIALAITASFLLHNLIYTFTVQPAKSFLQIYPNAVGIIDRLTHSPETQSADTISGQSRSYETLRNTMYVGQHAIRRQQWTIGWLIIGGTIGLLICYLSIDTVEEAQEAIKKTALIGTPIILFFAVFFYGIVFFSKLKDKWTTFSSFRRGLFLAIMLGAATVCTMILVPPLLGEGSLSDADVAIGLTINIISDVFITLFESSSEMYWDSKVSRAVVA